MKKVINGIIGYLMRLVILLATGLVLIVAGIGIILGSVIIAIYSSSVSIGNIHINGTLE